MKQCESVVLSLISMVSVSVRLGIPNISRFRISLEQLTGISIENAKKGLFATIMKKFETACYALFPLPEPLIRQSWNSQKKIIDCYAISLYLKLQTSLFDHIERESSQSGTDETVEFAGSYGKGIILAKFFLMLIEKLSFFNLHCI